MCKSWRLSLVWQQDQSIARGILQGSLCCPDGWVQKGIPVKEFISPKKTWCIFDLKQLSCTRFHDIHPGERAGTPEKMDESGDLRWNHWTNCDFLPGRQTDSQNLQTSVTIFKGLAAEKWPPPLCWLVGVVKNASPIFLRVGDGRSISTVTWCDHLKENQSRVAQDRCLMHHQ